MKNWYEWVVFVYCFGSIREFLQHSEFGNKPTAKILLSIIVTLLKCYKGWTAVLLFNLSSSPVTFWLFPFWVTQKEWRGRSSYGLHLGGFSKCYSRWYSTFFQLCNTVIIFSVHFKCCFFQVSSKVTSSKGGPIHSVSPSAKHHSSSRWSRNTSDESEARPDPPFLPP